MELSFFDLKSHWRNVIKLFWFVKFVGFNIHEFKLKFRYILNQLQYQLYLFHIIFSRIYVFRLYSVFLLYIIIFSPCSPSLGPSSTKSNENGTALAIQYPYFLRAPVFLLLCKFIWYVWLHICYYVFINQSFLCNDFK